MPETITAGEFSIMVAIIGFFGAILVAFITAYFTSSNENKKIRHKFVEILKE